ncbi:MAG: S-layer homology domain-containing protein [Clostridiales bacterium]|nr:MAG: S-layer homology domain-containing protein [Clostridiales bacterium]
MRCKNGIIKGDERGYFNGGKNITREEIVIITARVLADKDAYKKADFKDISSKYLYLDELEKVYGLGIISGDEKHKNFNPQGFALRSSVQKNDLSDKKETTEKPTLQQAF